LFGKGKRRSGRADGRDRLDLDELVGIAEKRDPEQRARRTSKPFGHDIPDAHEIRPLDRDDVDRRFEERLRAASRRGERVEEILRGSCCLRLEVARRDDATLLVQRSSTGGEEETFAVDEYSYGVPG